MASASQKRVMGMWVYATTKTERALCGFGHGDESLPVQALEEGGRDEW